MKNLLFTLFLGAMVFSAKAQQNWTNDVVQESDVPEAVLTAFNSKYDGAKVVRWEKRTWVGKNEKSAVKYVVIYDKDQLRHRSRYKEDGSGLSTTTYYWGAKKLAMLPQPILDYASNNYAGYKLMSAEKEYNLKNGKYVYRIRLKKGATKVVVYLNESGEEVSKDNIDQEILEHESETEK